jgi:putative Mn2+ efflux pump MntP
LGVIFLVIVSTIFNGFALAQLWEWFITTTFAIKAITIPQAIGLSMVIGFITGNYNTESNDKDDTEKWIKAIVLAILKPTFALVFGWIIYQFIV